MNILEIIHSWDCSSVIINYFNKTEQNEACTAIQTPVLKLFFNLASYMKIYFLFQVQIWLNATSDLYEHLGDCFGKISYIETPTKSFT